MNILIIDQFKEFFKKIKSIVGWHREGEQEEDNKNIPVVPIILSSRPGTIVDNNNPIAYDTPSNVNNTTVLWTQATAETKQDIKIKNVVTKKLSKFMRRSQRGKARGA